MIVLAGEDVQNGSIVYADSNGKLVVATDNSHKYVLLSATADDRTSAGDGTVPIRAYKPGMVHNISESGLNVGEVFLASDGSLSNTAPTTGSEVLSIGFLLKDDAGGGDLLLFNPVHKYSL